ncbi:hypothetical protein QT381_07165 [Galbitalea sp. SE-J8]|uniref:hypothetical protein n=1 Tax=Galbitalea sp. SE-J8 TaxID=3054952 RepID=UPI00259CD3A3|nr:hypothetical protein [Galbitalea sp. SE-J8]MDM4762784.1 hypothetical protein [Galbitalea sp. SE-J8]
MKERTMAGTRTASTRVGIAIAGVGVLVIAGAAGAFATVGPTLLAPAGVSAAPGVDTSPMPNPQYAVNANGQSYGSAADANSPDTEPDLIGVVADNGKTGYVLKTELAEADGSNITSPEEAVKWENGGAKVNHTVDVYESDGTTVIGTFTVYGG